MANLPNGPSIAGVVFPLLTFFTILLSIAPLVWHVRNRNLAASSLIFWIVFNNIFYFINAIIWPNDDLDSWWRGYGLCDFEVKLQLAVTIGVPTSLVCIMRRLAKVLDTNQTVLQPTRAQRTRQYVIEIMLCFGAPVYMVIIHYIVQNVRYYIFAISGCVPSLDDSWPSIVLIEIWSPFFSVVAVYYSIIVVLRMHRYRKEFAAIISASSSGLTKSRFLRLFFMSLTLIILGLPTQFYVLYKNTTYTLVKYSWSRVHGPGWWDIILVPTGGSVSFDHWIQLAVGFTIFVFFGMGHDMKKMYRRCLLWLGFGRVFPSLRALGEEGQARRSTSQTLSHGSRAQLFLRRKFTRESRSATSGSKTDSTTRSSLTASPVEVRLPSVLLDRRSEKEPDSTSASPTSMEPLSSRLNYLLTLAHLSGPYSTSRALSLFARSPHRARPPQASVCMQPTLTEHQREGRTQATGEITSNEKAEA